MTAFTNPLADDPDPEKPKIWELGYLTGFQDPDQADPFLPLSPELLEVFNNGIDTGRDDAIQSTAVKKSELRNEDGSTNESSLEDLAEHVTIEGFFELSAHVFERAAIGLVGIIITVLGIPGDTQLHPLEDDFEEPYTGPEDDTNVFFVAACPRPDHPQVEEGVTSDGYWAGSGHNDFGDALRDALAHGHSEVLVARCSLTDNTCGPVWIRR
jgi:hypothetical protein